MLGPLCALASSFTWAIGITRYSALSKSFPAFTVNVSRAMVALPLFVLATFIQSGGYREGLASLGAVHLGSVGWFTLSMVSSYALGDLLFLMSTHSLGVPAALAIASSYPLWSALVAWVVRGEALGLSKMFGLFLVVGGTALVILTGYRNSRIERAAGGTVSWSKSYPAGVIFAVCTSLLWATNTFSVSQGGQDLIAPVSNVVRMIVALVLCPLIGLPIAARMRKSPSEKTPIMLPWKSLKPAFWVFVLEGFGGSYLFLYGLTHSPLAIGAALSSLAPVISVPIAWMMKTESFSFGKTLGVVLTVAGVWLLVGI